MSGLEKLPTHIAGFDLVARGGLPKGRTTLVAGTAGSAKTVFAVQFLVEGILRGEPGVFVTFEEPPEDIRRNMLGFGWDIPRWEAEGRWFFMDASLQPEEVGVEAGAYDLGALLARVESACRKIGAKRVSIDSVGAIFSQFNDTSIIRAELFRMAAVLKRLNVTAVLTTERTQDYGEISRYGVEEFVSDNVILLRNVLEEEKRRRTVEILKFRGADHQKGEYPFSVVPNSGINVIPLTTALGQTSTNKRIHSGNSELDGLCGGGFFRDSVILVSGATGTGKTLMVTEFMSGGVEKGERCLILAFEESREQLFRNAGGWGHDFAELEKSGRMKVVCVYPEAMSVEDHLIQMKAVIEEFKPDRLAVDSLSAIERITTPKSFREFVIGLTSFVKQREMAALFTATTATLTGGSAVTDAHISTITDSIILMRYVELHGEMRRGLTVLKMRGSPHDKEIREFTIDANGMHIGRPFRNVSGILSGNPVQISPREELDRLGGMFKDDE